MTASVMHMYTGLQNNVIPESVFEALKESHRDYLIQHGRIRVFSIENVPMLFSLIPNLCRNAKMIPHGIPTPSGLRDHWDWIQVIAIPWNGNYRYISLIAEPNERIHDGALEKEFEELKKLNCHNRVFLRDFLIESAWEHLLKKLRNGRIFDSVQEIILHWCSIGDYRDDEFSVTLLDPCFVPIVTAMSWAMRTRQFKWTREICVTHARGQAIAAKEARQKARQAAAHQIAAEQEAKNAQQRKARESQQRMRIEQEIWEIEYMKNTQPEAIKAQDAMKLQEAQTRPTTRTRTRTQSQSPTWGQLFRNFLL